MAEALLRDYPELRPFVLSDVEFTGTRIGGGAIDNRPHGIEHALSCSRGGFPSIRHNEIRDITADLLSEVCHNVGTEPGLQHVTEEQLTHRSANREDGLDWTLWPRVSGEEIGSAHSLTYGCSTLLRKATVLSCLNATAETKWRREGRMTSE